MTKNWEKEKLRLHELYMHQNLKLAIVREKMIKEHNFQASERAYKQKFKEWCWFKKQPRSPGVGANSTTQENILGNHEPADNRAIDNTHLYRMSHLQRAHGRGHPSLMDQHQQHTAYDQFSHMHVGFDTDYAAVPAAEMGMAYHTHTHIGQPQSPTGATLGPYERSHVHAPQQISLPSVAHLQLATFKDNIRNAERNVESVQYDQAQAALENAMRSLHWLRESHS